MGRMDCKQKTVMGILSRESIEFDFGFIYNKSFFCRIRLVVGNT